MSDGARSRPSGNWLARTFRRVIPGARRHTTPAQATVPEASATTEQDDQPESVLGAVAADAAAPTTVWEPPVGQDGADSAAHRHAQDQPVDHAATVVDPLERARAALADARRQMPGMLGEATDEPSLPAPVTPSAPPDRLDESGILAEVRALIETLREERRRFAEEVQELRTVVGELRGEVQRLSATGQPATAQSPVAEAQAGPVDPPPIAPVDEESPLADAATGAGTYVAGDERAAAAAIDPLAIAPGAEELPAETRPAQQAAATAATAAAAATTGTEEHRPAENRSAEPQRPQEAPRSDEHSREDEEAAQPTPAGLRWRPAERGDFGFWARPEALDLLEESAFVEMGSASADAAAHRVQSEVEAGFYAEGSAESEVAESAAAAQASATRTAAIQAAEPAPMSAGVASSSAEAPSAAETSTAAGSGVSEAAAEPYRVELSPGDQPLGLSVGPLHGVRRLSALEHRLAGCPGVGRVELASYRGGEASFRVTLRGPASLQEVIGSVQGEDLTVSAYSVDPDRGAVRVRLAESGADGRA